MEVMVADVDQLSTFCGGCIVGDLDENGVVDMEGCGFR